jgi:hypothetical protein
MDASIAPLLLFTFVAAMIGTWIELRSSLKPATCPECPHCREVIRLQRLAEEEEARRQAELRSYVSRRYRLDDKDDERRL